MNIPANILHLYPGERARQEKRDALMDALTRAERRADYDDWETYYDSDQNEVSLQTFAEVTWDEGEWSNGGTYRYAIATVTGARLGNVLIDPDTLDAAFPGSVAIIEERLSEQFTRGGEYE